VVLPRPDVWRDSTSHVKGQRPGRDHGGSLARAMALGTAKNISFEK
jgi:hypothetical protein